MRKCKDKDWQQEYLQLVQVYNQLSDEKAELEYQWNELKASIGQLRRQDAEVRELHESARKLKHDMKNHLMVVASYLSSGEYDAAKVYVSQILDKLNAVHSYIETGNLLMNHILNEKLNFARGQGISVKAEIENLSFGRMESLDFSALLSNLLDNAIEACCLTTAPELFLGITKRRNYETVLVKNKIDGSVLEQNPDLYTTKKEKDIHGLGVVQTREIVGKYGGICDFYEEDDWFCACAFIPV
ncbi:MAG: GHKL domain-containing protein [Lachnospiraceae bacterium]|nr:GHKL domain-containing protein [Lachnospiraceae bacterium]